MSVQGVNCPGHFTSARSIFRNVGEPLRVHIFRSLLRHDVYHKLVFAVLHTIFNPIEFSLCNPRQTSSVFDYKPPDIR